MQQTNTRARIRRIASGTAAALTLITAAQTGLAQQPATPSDATQNANSQNARAILKRAFAGEKSARTREVVYQIDIAGPNGAGTFLNRSFLAGRRYRIQTTLIGKGVGGLSGLDANSLTICDGKTETTYNGKSYSKAAPDQDIMTGGISSFADGLDKLGDNLTTELLPPMTLDGHPVYAVRVTVGKGEDKLPLTFFIDQASNRLRKMEAIGENPEASSYRFVVDVKSVVLNKPLPDSLFRFTPPPGSKSSKVALNTFKPLVAAVSGMTAHKAQSSN